MKIYILINNDKNSLNMPIKLGRKIRAYDSKARAELYGRKFSCLVVELDVEKGKIVYEKSTINKPPS